MPTLYGKVVRRGQAVTVRDEPASAERQLLDLDGLETYGRTA